MSNAYSFNDSRGNSNYRFINTGKTQENSNILNSVEQCSCDISKTNLEKNKFTSNILLESPLLTLQARSRYFRNFLYKDSFRKWYKSRKL